LFFYNAIRIERLEEYTYTPYQSELQVKLIGKNFINTARDLQCRIANLDAPKVYLYATYVFFSDSSQITCTFQVEPFVVTGDYKISASNNGA